MLALTRELDPEIELLVAIGAAVACGCQACLRKLVERAVAAGLSRKKLASAAIIGQFVKDQPAEEMRALSDALLGTHLGRRDGAASVCPLEDAAAGGDHGCGR
ncbi:MAG: carboxymuconolactone decarboxylase family protein [Desulfosarcinaceae bacterium]|nr:carboxymuconolactone decarboxylase family protein [Desulfosarcinaceae bacterium]